MRSIVIDGDVWRVVRVPAGDPRLIDRTGTERLATTDQRTRTIRISDDVVPPLLDRVLLHEISHAITVSYGLLEPLRDAIPRQAWVPSEEWAVQLLENHAIEALRLSRMVLGRPVCVREYCFD